MSERLRSEADAMHHAVASQFRSQHVVEQDIAKGQLDDAVRAFAQRMYEVQMLEREAQRMQHPCATTDTHADGLADVFVQLGSSTREAARGSRIGSNWLPCA